MMPDKDNEFDDLIRAAAENHHSSGANPDWDKMEQMLDKQLPVEKSPRRRIWFILIPLFILLGGAYVYTAVNAKKSILKERQDSVARDKTALPAATGQVKKPATTAAIEQGKDSSVNEKIAAGPQSKSSTPDLKTVTGKEATIAAASMDTKNPTNKNESIYTKAKTKRIKEKKAGTIKTIISGGDVTENSNGSTTPAEAQLPGENKTIDKTNAIDAPLQNKMADSVTVTQAEKYVSPKPSATAKIPDSTAQKNKTAGKKSKATANKKNPFEFSLLYAPELTTIEFSRIDKPGSNYGLLVGYRVSNHFTVQTGVIRSRKNYTTDGYNFTLRRPLPAGRKLNEVSGYCRMYEIPFNIKSFLLKRKKFNLSYTVGISSYFMTGESYNYYYSTPNGDSSNNAKFTSQNNYWLSLATVGLGIEKDITENLNLSVSPFLKVPFRGMGPGKLKLMSTGINFLLTYKPFLLKK